MTKIGVISDTHLQVPDERLFQVAQRQFADASMILHAGDLVSLAVLDAFAGKTVVAVCGNMCGVEASQHLPSRQEILVDGFRIGLIHGWGPRQGLEDRIFPEFQDVDAIVYGHTHTPANHLKQGVLMFNPGAYMAWSMGREAGSVGVLTIEDDMITGEIIPL